MRSALVLVAGKCSSLNPPQSSSHTPPFFANAPRCSDTSLSTSFARSLRG